MRRPIILVVALFAAIPMVTGASADKEDGHRTGDFRGKVVWASIKGSRHGGMTFTDVEVKYTGKNAFLVGKLCAMTDAQSPWEGLTTWVRTDEIDVIWEFPSVAKARQVYADAMKRQEAQRTFPAATPPPPTVQEYQPEIPRYHPK